MISFRFQRLIEKLLSVKFVIFVIATVLKCFGVIGGAEWLTVTMAVIAGREFQKFKAPMRSARPASSARARTSPLYPTPSA